MQIDQTGQRHQPAAIDHLGAGAVHPGTQLGDQPVTDQQVHRVEDAREVDGVAPLEATGADR